MTLSHGQVDHVCGSHLTMRGGSRTCLIQNVFFLEDLQSILLYCVAAQDPFALYYYGKQVCIPLGYSCLDCSNLPGCGGQMVIDYCQELLNWLVFLQIEKKRGNLLTGGVFIDV